MAPRASRRVRDPMRLGIEVALFAAALFVGRGAHPSPATGVVGIAFWVTFLASVPARSPEPVPARPATTEGVN